ncbi:MAG TPA: V-type ATP synthase subunit D [Firmicutes bacterium]|nr:V-type ATP synthase subunit D [Bacillota bacterium]
MKIKANPNRMVLLRLKRRLNIARRGHKLLKDKLEGMMKDFIKTAKEFREDTEIVDREYLRIESLFALAESEMGKETIKLLSKKRTDVRLKHEKKNIMGVVVPEFKLDIKGKVFDYPVNITTPEYDFGIQGFINFLPKLISLAEKIKALEELSRDIEKTRRRVNALEYIMIPSLEETIKYITNKLDELERESHARISRIKEIIRGEEKR